MQKNKVCTKWILPLFLLHCLVKTSATIENVTFAPNPDEPLTTPQLENSTEHPTTSSTGIPTEESTENLTPTSQATSSTPTSPTHSVESSTTPDPGDRFIGSKHDVNVEHVDFVALRLKHLLASTSSNITELRTLQKKEFEKNTAYREAWDSALEAFNSSKRKAIYEALKKSSVILSAPEEFHVALIMYTGYAYYDFNAKTREICSGADIEEYEYKSLFKFLHLAIETFGPEIWKVTGSCDEKLCKIGSLFRGVPVSFGLKVGQKVAFQHFISTSRNPDIGASFSGGGATLFEIKNQSLHHGVYLKYHSFFESEEEVLISPVEIFQVESITETMSPSTNMSYTRYSLKPREIPNPVESPECAISLAKVAKEAKVYVMKLKLAVTVMGAILGTILVIGFAYGTFILIKRRPKPCKKLRAESELQLT